MSENGSLDYQQFRDETDSIVGFLNDLEQTDGLRFHPEAPDYEPTKEEIDRLRLARKLLINLAKNINMFTDSDISLRPNQINGLKELRTFIANLGQGELKGYFRQPTGAGKTILFGSIAKMLDVQTLILVPKINLLDQTKETLVNLLGVPEEEIGIIGGGESEMGKKYTISTYKSHILNMKRGNGYTENMGNTEFVVCDEVHRSLGEETQEALEVFEYEEDEILTGEEMAAEREFLEHQNEFIGNSALTLGFTATPKLRFKDVEKTYNRLIASATYKELIEGGYLVPMKVYQVPAYITSEESSIYLTEEKQVEILEREDVYRKLLNKFNHFADLEYEEDNPLLSAVFCTNINECVKFKELAEEEYGYRCHIVTSEIGKDTLKEAERKLLAGEIDFIVTVDVLGEGWDFPPLNCVMVARPSRSPARILQPIGRGMRIKVGKKWCYVFEADWRVGYKPVSSTGGENRTVGPTIPRSTSDQTGNNNQAGSQKALTVAQALANIGESINGVCEGAEGELEFVKYYEVDSKGRAKEVELPDESKVEATSLGTKAAKHYGVSIGTLKRKVEDAKLESIPGVKGRSGPKTVDLYKASEVDTLFAYKVYEVDGKGRAKEVELPDESKVEATSLGDKAANHYGTSQGTLKKKVEEAGLKPIPGVKGKSGTLTVDLYKASEVDTLFAYKKYDLDGKGRAKEVELSDGSKVEATNLGDKAANHYGVNIDTLKKKVEDAGLKPIPGVKGKSGTLTVDLYKASEVDALFAYKVYDLDSKGRAKEVELADESKVEATSLGNKAAKHYGVSYTTLNERVEEAGLKPIPGVKGRAVTRILDLYKASEVDKLFVYKVYDLDSKGRAKEVELADKSKVEATNLGNKAANHYGVNIYTLKKKIEEAGLQPIPGVKGKSGTKRVDLYKASEVDALFPYKIYDLDSKGRAKEVALPDESKVEATSLGTKAAKHYGVSRGTLKRKVEEAGLESIPGVKGKSGPRTVDLYKASEVDALFSK